MQYPPKNPPHGGRPSERKSALTPIPDKHSRMFSTGNHVSVEGAAQHKSQRSERGARIFSDVKRAVLFAFVLVVVGVVLVQFVSAL